MLAWLSGIIVLLVSPRANKYERWHAVQAIVFGIAFSAFMVPAILASVGILGAPPDWLGFVLAMLGIAFVAGWLALMAFAALGKRLRLPGAAHLADRFA